MSATNRILLTAKQLPSLAAGRKRTSTGAGRAEPLFSDPLPLDCGLMKVKCHQLSSAGAVRDHNEDFLVFWEPEDFSAREASGSIAILADGVGGEGNGDVASRLAAETALAVAAGWGIYGLVYFRKRSAQLGRPIYLVQKPA